VFIVVLPGIHSKGNIPFTDGKELSLIINKICAEYFSGLLERERKLKMCTD
jgi:hypothetical protein